MIKYADLEFPETGFKPFEYTSDAIRHLINTTNGLVTTHIRDRQEKLRAERVLQVLESPTMTIEKGTIVEVAPTKIYNKGWQDISNIVMPLYRVTERKNGGFDVTPMFGDDYTSMLYQQLKGTLEAPTFIAEIIPALQRLRADDLEKILVNLSIKRYARKEGKGQILSAYARQISIMLNRYQGAKEEEKTSTSIDMEAVAKLEDTSLIDPSLEGELEKHNTYALLESAPVIDQAEEARQAVEKRRTARLKSKTRSTRFA